MRAPREDRRHVSPEGRAAERAARQAGGGGASGGELDRLRDGALRLGVSLDEDAVMEFERFLRELRQWAPRSNLVARGDLPVIVERHILDSLAAVPVLQELGDHLSFADIGSGAGFPGIPIAIALRPRRALLVEPRQRRSSFLRAVARTLPEIGVEVANARLEDLPFGPGEFDAVLSRAALPIQSLFEAGARLLRPGGLIVVFRGPRAASGERSSDVHGDARGALFERVERREYRIPALPVPLQLEVWRRADVPRETPPLERA